MKMCSSMFVTVVMMIGAWTPEITTKLVEAQGFGQFQGTWHVLSLECGGNQDEEDLDKYTFTFQAQKLILREGDDLAGVIFELDEKHSPRQITFGRMQGIYEFKEDYLHICYTTSQKRPTEFTTTEERPDDVLMVLKKNSRE